MREIADPFNLFSNKLEINSSNTENQFNVCPKCGKEMGMAAIASNERVYYCRECRISAPLPKK